MQAVHTTIKPKTNIGAACATENGRYAIAGALCKGNRLIATDGQMLAIASADVERTAEAPAEVIIERKAFKANTRELRVNVQVEAVSGSAKSPKTEIFSTVEGNFPDAKAVLPSATNKRLWFHLNAELLARLASAIGADGVSIGFDANLPAERPTVVLPKSRGERADEPRDDDKAFGVLMPIAGDAEAAEAEYVAKLAEFVAAS